MKNDDKLKLALLPTLDALVSIGRSDYKIYSNLDHDNIEEIKDWLFKPNDRKGDLVVSKELLAGFKNETVLYLGFSDTSSSSITRIVSNAIVINSNPVLDQEWILQKITHFLCNNKFEDFGWSQIRNVISTINAALPKESWFKCLFEDRLDKLGFSISETIPHALGKDSFTFGRNALFVIYFIVVI